jgi:hypothetical protein
MTEIVPTEKQRDDAYDWAFSVVQRVLVEDRDPFESIISTVCWMFVHYFDMAKSGRVPNHLQPDLERFKTTINQLAQDKGDALRDAGNARRAAEEWKRRALAHGYQPIVGEDDI